MARRQRVDPSMSRALVAAEAVENGVSEAVEVAEAAFAEPAVEMPRESVKRVIVTQVENGWADAQKLRDEVREGLLKVGREAGKFLDRVEALNLIESNTPWNSLGAEQVASLREHVKKLIG